MRYDDSIVAEVKARALFDILGPADEEASKKRAGRGKRAYVCPLCGRARIINPLSNGTWYCMYCQEGGNVFQLVARRDGITDGEAFKRVMQKYTGGESERRAPAVVPKAEPAKSTGPIKGWEQRCANYLRRCAARFDGSRAAAYMRDERGLTLETCHRFGCGYDDKAMKRSAGLGGPLLYGAPAVVYPYSRRLDYYGARLIKPTGGLEKAYQPVVSMAGDEPLFNPRALYGFSDVIVLEGPFDCMAITQAATAGSLNVGAVALCGTGANKLVRQLKTKASTARLLILMDNDAPGQKALPSIAKQLQSIGQNFDVIDSEAVFAGYKDADELLQREGTELLAEAVRFVLEEPAARL